MSDDERYLDLDECAGLLGLRSRQMKALTRDRDRGFPEPAGERDGPFWREDDVLRWIVAQDPQRGAQVRLGLWPDARIPAEFAGAVRLPNRHGLDDVVLVWVTPAGRVGVLWRPQPPGYAALSPAEVADEVDVVVLVLVENDFGPRGPSLLALHRARPDEQYLLGWPELARVLGQPLPYWPYLLRDPDLIAAWRPGAAVVTAPARTDLDTYPLLRMAALFDADHAGHATARTLVHLVQVGQHRSARDADRDLQAVGERAARLAGRGQDPGIVVAAQPLTIGNLDDDVADLDDDVQRNGWAELLSRADTLSWQCVRQVLTWDGGRYFAFAHSTRVDTTSAAGREWLDRLEPVEVRTAAFACMDDGDKGRAMRDPLTGAPVVLLDDGQVATAVPQWLPTISPLAEVILDEPIWIRVADGNLYPAPLDPTYGVSWGYAGGGPGALAMLIHRLLDDITAQAATSSRGVPEGLDELTEHRWPRGTVLPRELLEAARDGRPYHHP